MRLDSPITDVKPVMIPFFWDSWQNYEQEINLDIVGWGRTRLGTMIIPKIGRLRLTENYDVIFLLFTF